MCRSFVTRGTRRRRRRARMARAASSGVRSTPRHCASTRWREDIFPGPTAECIWTAGGKWYRRKFEIGLKAGHGKFLTSRCGCRSNQAILRLPTLALWCKVNAWNPNWAAEHLQTIRTLMERSAVYRRALAPIMLFAGSAGIAAAVVGSVFHLDSIAGFRRALAGRGTVAVAGAFLIARRQALQGTRTVLVAADTAGGPGSAAAFAGGIMSGDGFSLFAGRERIVLLASLIWVLFYGCALHAAGFFMPRGMKLFGWIFIDWPAYACVTLALLSRIDRN